MLNDTFMAIDIGTTKVTALAACRNDRHVIEVLGHGIHPCSGMSAECIVDREEIVTSISHATRKALNHLPGIKIKRAVLGISGTFVQSHSATGSLVLSRSHRAVTPNDIDQSVDDAVRKTVPKDFEVLHAIPRWFRLDGNANIIDPQGMEGGILEVDAHIVIGRQSIIKNLKQCVSSLGFVVEECSSQLIATSISVLNEEEQNIGILLIDIGGKTTSLLVCFEGNIYHSETLAIGGDDITSDINHYFQTPMENAEKLKIYSGSAWLEFVDPSEILEVTRFKNRRTITIPRQRLCKIIEARVEEIGHTVFRSLRSRDLMGFLYGGIILTGGTSMLDGIRERIQEQSQHDTHIGYPSGVVGFEEILNSPIYASSVGLLQYGYSRRDAKYAAYGTGMTAMIKKLYRWVHETI